MLRLALATPCLFCDAVRSGFFLAKARTSKINSGAFSAFLSGFLVWNGEGLQPKLF